MFSLDNFADCVSKLVRQFDALLRCSAPLTKLTSEPVTSTSQLSGFRLIQLLNVNLNAVTSAGSPEVEAENCRPLLQEFALQVALDMFAILAKHCTAHLREHNASKRKQVPAPLSTRNDFLLIYLNVLQVSSELNDLLPALVVWIDWMTMYDNVWFPPPSCWEPGAG